MTTSEPFKYIIFDYSQGVENCVFIYYIPIKSDFKLRLLFPRERIPPVPPAVESFFDLHIMILETVRVWEVW